MNDTAKVTLTNLNRAKETTNKVLFDDGRGNTLYLFKADDNLLGKPSTVTVTVTPA